MADKKKIKITDVVKSMKKENGMTPMDFGEIAKSILPRDFGNKGDYINPDKLVRSKSYDIFDDMLRDDAISPLVKLKKMLTLAFEFRVVAYQESKEAIEKAQFVSWVLNEFMKRSIFKTFWRIIDHEWYGFSLTEILYEYIDYGDYQGKIGISNLKSKPQKTFEFKPDSYGNLDGNGSLQQIIKGKTGGNQVINLDINKFLHHVYDDRNENPVGKSHLSDIYRAWWCKDVVYHFYTKHLETWGSPVNEALIPSTLKATEKRRIAEILDSFQNGTSFYHRNDVEFKQWKVMPPSHYESAIQLFNTAISRGLGVPDLLGFTSTGTGSYALGKEQAALFYGLIGVDRDSLIDLINYQLIPRLEDYNFDKTGKYSYMEVSRVKIKDFTTILDVFRGSYEAAGYNPGKLEDLNRFRTQLGFSEITADEHPEYLKTWNDIRRIGRGQDSSGNSDVIVDDKGNPIDPEFDPNNGLVMPVEDENDEINTEFSVKKDIERLNKKYQSKYAVDVEKDLNQLASHYENFVWESLDELSNEALRATVAMWNNNDIEIQSKLLELNKKSDLAKKIKQAHKEAHRRGMDSALKEIEDIINEGVVEDGE